MIGRGNSLLRPLFRPDCPGHPPVRQSLVLFQGIVSKVLVFFQQALSGGFYERPTADALIQLI